MNPAKLIGFICLLFLAKPALAQTNEQALPEKTRILFLLDGSGSMMARWEGQRTRMDIAKRLLAETVDSLQAHPNLELGLRVYGHLYPSRPQNCTDSRLEVPFASNNHQQIKDKLKEIAPKGNTPIAYSLEQSGEDFPTSSGVRNIIIIITDGLESCGGDPCAVSLELQKKNIFLKPFVIALGDQEGFEQQFDCIGAYFDASSIDQFRQALAKAIKQSIGKTTLSVELLDAQERPTLSDINLSFINNFTGEALYNFVHYRNRQGQTDTIRLDPVLSYDLIVQTLPPLLRSNIQLEGGTHNVIGLKVPQGSLQLSQKNFREYENGVQALIRKSGKPQVFHVQAIGSTSYLAGTYDVEVLTLPRTYFRGVEIKADETTLLSIPAPGIANIRADFSGIGDIYVLDGGKQSQLIYKLETKTAVNSLALQPGNYRLVFRALNAQGSKYTKVRDFQIVSGATANLNLFGR